MQFPELSLLCSYPELLSPREPHGLFPLLLQGIVQLSRLKTSQLDQL